MTVPQPFESKLLAAFNAFADEAFVEVDPWALSTQILAQANTRRLSFRLGRFSGLLPVAATLFLAAALITGLIGAAQLLRGPRSYEGVFVPQHDMFVPRDSAVVVALNDGRVLIAGGTYRSARPVKSAELINPATGAIVPVTGDVPGVAGAGLQLPDGRVFVVDYEWYSQSARAYVVDPVTGTSRAVGPLPRTSPTSVTGEPDLVLLADGHVLIAGGTEQVSPSLLFDPDAETFEQTGAMLTPRIHPALVRLADGRVLAAAGRTVGLPASIYFDTHGLRDDAEIYDPQTGTWSSAGRLASVRGSAWGTTTADGRVAIISTGATDSMFGAGLNYMHTADLYSPLSGTFQPLAIDWPGQATMTAIAGYKVLLTGTRTPTTDEARSGIRLVRWAATYDPATNVTTQVEPPRAILPTGALLSDQRVLIAGGYSDEPSDGGSRPVTWTETFE
jgi:hypothetical protein